MNTIKFLPNNQILLKINFRNSTCEKLLNKVNYTKELTTYYTIKNKNYA